MQKGASATPAWVRTLYPKGFQVLALPDPVGDGSAVTAAYRNGDILLFPAWFPGPAVRLIEGLQEARP